MQYIKVSQKIELNDDHKRKRIEIAKQWIFDGVQFNPYVNNRNVFYISITGVPGYPYGFCYMGLQCACHFLNVI